MGIVQRILMNLFIGLFAFLFSTFSCVAVQGWLDKNVEHTGAGITGMLIMGMMVLVGCLDMRDEDKKKL